MKKYFRIIILTLLIIITLGMNNFVHADLQEDRLIAYMSRVITKDSFTIPFLEKGDYANYIPQGLCKTKYNDTTYRLISCYNREWGYGCIHIIDGKGNYLRTVKIDFSVTSKFDEGSAGNHCGGIVEYNGKIYVVSTNILIEIGKEKLFKAKNGDILIYNSTKQDYDYYWDSSSEYNFSFCTANNGILWIGDHESKNEYSYVLGYTFENEKPKLHSQLAIPAKCQGMVFSEKHKNKVILTQTNGYIGSRMGIYKYYDTEKGKNGVKDYAIDYGKWWNSKVVSFDIPCGAQNVYLTDSQNVYILFESGSKAAQKSHTWSWKEKRVVLFDLYDSDWKK